MGRYTLEHWRDDELIDKIELTPEMFKTRKNGSVCVTFPPGCITIATKDELHFNPDGLKEIL
jgi:hypothetical protein